MKIIKMKLKQRIGALVVILGGALMVSLVLNIVTYQNRVKQVVLKDRPVLNRELNSIDSESSNAQYTDKSELYVSRFVQAFEQLKKLPHQHHPKSGALPQQANASYEEIVQQLLTDKTFNREDTVRSFIQFSKALKEYTHAEETESEDEDIQKIFAPDTKKDTLADIPTYEFSKSKFNVLEKHIHEGYKSHLKKVSELSKPMKFKVHASRGSPLQDWQKWHNGITQYALYNEYDPTVNSLVKGLGHQPIVGMSTMADYGTQIKMIFKLADGSQGLFKPMRFQRSEERNPNHFYFDDFERHHSEIAAFHLDRVMQFRRVPPNSGRMINITTTIERYASKSFKKTIYISPAGNKCFYGKCDYYCDSGNPICAVPERPHMIEGSFAAWLPFGKGTAKKSWENPWRRSYSKFNKAGWETDPDYCDIIKETEPYNDGRLLLDVMDISIFDYFMGNQDRHHFHTFKMFGNFTSPMLYDNGRGFGSAMFDEPSILVPLEQCCIVRYSTLRKLLNYESSPQQRLSERMRHSLIRDPLSSGPYGPVLSEGHLKALDRRVSKVLEVVWKCVSQRGYDDVVQDDGF